MRKLAQTLGVDDRVMFLGAQADVKPFYGAADVFALPTLYDPFPNAALEALACGLPIVTTSTCGAAELVTDANGRIVAATDAAALAIALAQLMANKAQMRHAARQSVEHLSLDAMASKLQTLYAYLIPAAAATGHRR
jgi:UDP-glucose:(heptosyl)LPS alpha-1,3-glucosyltransferase